MTEKTRASLLTEEDKFFLSNLQSWMRSSMEFSILGIQPRDADLVRIDGKLSPYLALMLGTNACFISLGELREICEDSAQNKLIYEAWLHSGLMNAYIFSKPLNTGDARRFIDYFKIYHEIDDEEGLAELATTVLHEAAENLYNG